MTKGLPEPFCPWFSCGVLYLGRGMCLMCCWSSGQSEGEAEPLLFISIVQIFEEYNHEGTLYY